MLAKVRGMSPFTSVPVASPDMVIGWVARAVVLSKISCMTDFKSSILGTALLSFCRIDL